MAISNINSGDKRPLLIIAKCSYDMICGICLAFLMGSMDRGRVVYLLIIYCLLMLMNYFKHTKIDSEPIRSRDFIYSPTYFI